MGWIPLDAQGVKENLNSYLNSYKIKHFHGRYLNMNEIKKNNMKSDVYEKESIINRLWQMW